MSGKNNLWVINFVDVIPKQSGARIFFSINNVLSYLIIFMLFLLKYHQNSGFLYIYINKTKT